MEHQLFKSAQKLSFYDRFSHELRTTLTGIVGFSEYIAHTAEEPMMKFAAEVIQQGGHDVLRVMGAYVEYFRIESGHFNLQLSSFSLVDLIQEVVSCARTSAHQRSAKVIFSCDDESWSCRIFSDLGFFRQVLDLLLQDFISTSNKDELIQINLQRGTSRDSFTLSFVKTSEHEAARAMQLYQSFWSSEDGFMYAKQEGPGMCGALAKRFVTELLGHVNGALASDKTFQLDLVFPVRAEKMKCNEQ
jgi:K+-sensing histidine kinase KdpD